MHTSPVGLFAFSLTIALESADLLGKLVPNSVALLCCYSHGVHILSLYQACFNSLWESLKCHETMSMVPPTLWHLVVFGLPIEPSLYLQVIFLPIFQKNYW
jgi:hypothetical protein